MDEAVRHLIDKQTISEAVLRYCRGVDRAEPDLIRSAFFPDAIDDHGGTRMLATEFADFIVQRKLEEVDFSIHRITNQLIDLLPDGHTAVSESLVNSVQRVKGDDVVQFSWSRYLDRFERRDDEWRIGYRLVVHDFHTSVPLVADSWRLPTMDVTKFVVGGRAGDDPITGRRDFLFRPLSPS